MIAINPAAQQHALTSCVHVALLVKPCNPVAHPAKRRLRRKDCSRPFQKTTKTNYKQITMDQAHPACAEVVKDRTCFQKIRESAGQAIFNEHDEAHAVLCV